MSIAVEAVKGLSARAELTMALNGISLERVPATRKNSRRPPQPRLEIAGALVDDSTLQSLIEECIVPALVDLFLQEKGSDQQQKAA